MYPWIGLQTHISNCPCMPMGHQFGSIPPRVLPCILPFHASSFTAPTRKGSHPAVFTQPQHQTLEKNTAAPGATSSLGSGQAAPLE